MITVVAALVERGGRMLICQRRRGDHFAFKWEFPGGKVRAGETLQQGLARELSEELGVAHDAISIGREVYRTRHRYSEVTEEIALVFFAAQLPAASLKNLAFERIEWAPLAALPGYDFLPADRELVAQLARGALRVAEPNGKATGNTRASVVS